MMRHKKRGRADFYKLFIKTRLLGIVLSSILPMFLVCGIILYQFYTSYNGKVHDHLSTLVKMHQQDIDTFLEEKLGNISFLANTFGYEELSNPEVLRHTLELLQGKYGPVFVDLGIVNEKGIQIAYAGPYQLGEAQYSEMNWFRKALQNDYFISDVFLGLRELPHFIVSVKQTHDNKPWILRATIDFVYFNNLMEKVRVGETGFAYILNRDGEFQTQPRYAISIDTIPIFTKMKSVNNKNLYFLDDPSGFFGGKIAVASFLKKGEWILVYEQSVSDVFQSFLEAFKISIIIVILGTIATVTMGFLRFSKMMGSITRAEKEKQLMNEQIIETGKLASVGELAAGIAHEINNPVAIMVEEAGWIEDLLEEEEFQEGENLEEFHRALRQINAQGKRCKSITHKLLSFARKTDTKIIEADINELLEEIISLSEKRAKYSSVTITKNFEENIPKVKLSQTEMQQVFLNLINNALDAMEKSGGTIDISSEQTEEDIIIKVSDTGMGIPEANLTRIFDPFFTTKKVGKGTGLGLSICYGIIKRMGGDIMVHSIVGSGTTFTINFPKNKSTEKTPTNPCKQESPDR